LGLRRRSLVPLIQNRIVTPEREWLRDVGVFSAIKIADSDEEISLKSEV
jgi:hypothetical protein